MRFGRIGMLRFRVLVPLLFRRTGGSDLRTRALERGEVMHFEIRDDSDPGSGMIQIPSNSDPG